MMQVVNYSSGLLLFLAVPIICILLLVLRRVKERGVKETEAFPS